MTNLTIAHQPPGETCDTTSLFCELIARDTEYASIAKRELMRRKDIDWEAVYTSFLPRIFHFFCYKVGDEQIAEDLTSITFEKAWISR
jgi:hypothetical protein